MDKFTRTNFLKDETIEGILEKDLIKNYFDLFQIKRPTTLYTLTREHIGRPDLLSLVVYGNMSYWWILAKFNKIDDWWNDVVIGDLIQIPDVLDIQDWYMIVKSKMRGRS